MTPSITNVEKRIRIIKLLSTYKETSDININIRTKDKNSRRTTIRSSEVDL